MTPGRGISVLLEDNEGSLSDGRSRIEGRELGACCAAVGQWLRDAKVGPDEVTHAELHSSVPGALILLALLELGDSFVLTVPGARGLGRLDSPALCNWRLSVRDTDEFDPTRPETFLALEALASAGPTGLGRGRVLLRTSGSLGAPKLVAHTHAGLLANAANVVERLDLRGSDRVFIPVPLGHMYGLGAALLPALHVGAEIELLASANLLSCFERERQARPTIAFLTPNLARTLVRPRKSSTHYRHVVVAGDKLEPELFRALEAIYHRVVPLYGSTELGVICAVDPRVDPSTAELRATVGRALPGVELELRGVEEEIGELWCRHPLGFEGYVDERGQPFADTSAPDSATGDFFATRDLARLRSDGRVELLGRCDHAVKRDGRLVLLAEVEAALAQLDGVHLAAAIATSENTRRGRTIVAFCEPEPGAELAGATLRRACQGRLPAYAVPDEIHVLPKLPVLPSSKLDRKALHALAPIRSPKPLHETNHA